MKIFAILPLLISTCVSALPTPSATEELSKRDGTALVSALNTLESSVTTLNTSVTNFNPAGLSTLSGLFTILKNSDAVGTNIIAATKAANNMAALSGGAETPVIEAALTLVPMVESLLTNLVTARSKIDSIAVIFSARKTVLQAVQLDDSLSSSLINAIGAKLPSSYQAVLPSIMSELQGSFNKTIANYSTHMKGIDLPAIPSKVLGGQVINL